jgi:hypothetical protein
MYSGIKKSPNWGLENYAYLFMIIVVICRCAKLLFFDTPKCSLDETSIFKND